MGLNTSRSVIKSSVSNHVTKMVQETVFKCSNVGDSTAKLSISIDNSCCINALNLVSKINNSSMSVATNDCDFNYDVTNDMTTKLTNTIVKDIEQKANFLTANIQRSLIDRTKTTIENNITEEFLMDCSNAALAQSLIDINIINGSKNETKQITQICPEISLTFFKDGAKLGEMLNIIGDSGVIDLNSIINWKTKLNGLTSFTNIQKETIKFLMTKCNDSNDVTFIKDNLDNLSKMLKNDFVKLFPDYVDDYDFYYDLGHGTPENPNYSSIENINYQIIILYLIDRPSQTFITADSKLEILSNLNIIKLVINKLKNSDINYNDVLDGTIKVKWNIKTNKICQPYVNSCNPALKIMNCRNIIKDIYGLSMSDAFQSVSGKMKSFNKVVDDITTGIDETLKQSGANLVFVLLALFLVIIAAIVLVVLINKRKNKSSLDSLGLDLDLIK